MYVLFSYGLLIMSNSKLESLWKPGTLQIGYGNVLIHGNINLCRTEINAFNRSTKFLRKGTFSQSQNGYLCPGNVASYRILSIFENEEYLFVVLFIIPCTYSYNRDFQVRLRPSLCRCIFIRNKVELCF